MTVIIPRVHLNGTSKGELLEQFKTADRALRAAEEALQRAAPNERDYYVIEPNPFEGARAAHVARIKALTKVREEIMAIAIGVVDQKGGRP
jgi:hypothetical protein